MMSLLLNFTLIFSPLWIHGLALGLAVAHCDESRWHALGAHQLCDPSWSSQVR